MEGLRPGQTALLQFAPPLGAASAPVEADAGGASAPPSRQAAIPCRLESVHGPLSTFAPEAGLDLSLRLRLELGAQCFLLYDDGAGRVAVRGVALGSEATELIEFIPVDGVGAADRRSVPRVPIIAGVSLSRIPPGGRERPLDTVTANLSAGGALLVRPRDLEPAPRWQLRLRLPDAEAPIVCEAALTRVTASHLGVHFSTIAETDQVRIVRLLASRLRAPHGT
ncbi:MAG TPA: PilZ domain-containing protein [Solirubrobacteraceae bacterium]|nr:PilZ domain-containing protein [Solirubrobacteraceae bacterium]